MSAETTSVKPHSFGIEGVSVTVKCKIGGVAVVAEPDADGYILGLEEVEEVTIIIEIDPGINVFGFNVDGNKNITPAKNYSQSGNGKMHRKKVPIHIPVHNKSKEPYTKYNENHIKLLEIGTRGYFAVWEAAVVFQNGLGFLTTQQVYRGAVFQNGGDVFCPEFSGKWPQLVTFLKEVCKHNGISNLPYFDARRFLRRDNIDNVNLDDGEGIVKWFNVAQGFGAISTNKGDAFVHYKDIDSKERLVSLEKEAMILYDKLIPNAISTGFAHKAVGVLAPEA